MKVPSHHSRDALDPPSTKISPYKQFSKLRIIKNVAVLCIGVLLLFTAYDGLTMLQSTMNREHGIGVISQAVIYVCFCISAVLFPKYIIKKLGSKLTFAFSTLTYLPYVASNFYSHWILTIPTSILIGLGAALLWGSQASYLNDISLMYAELIMSDSERTNLKAKGIPRNNSVDIVKGRCNRSLSCDLNVIYRNDVNDIIAKSWKSIDAKRYSVPFGETPKQLIGIGNNKQYIDDGALESEQPNYGSFKNAGSLSLNINEPHENRSTFTKSIESSKQQSKADNRCKLIESTTAKFFGLHGVAYMSSHIWSNLMTYYILHSEISDDIKSNSNCSCGADYCNVDSMCFEQNIVEPSDQIRFILTAVCICIGIGSALIIFLFLDPLETEKEEVSFSTGLLMATYNLAKRKKLLLLIPSSLYLGMVQGFFTGDFNKSFVGCAWGTYHVGLVAVCYGTVSGVSAFSSGWLVKRLGRIPIFSTATLVNLGANVFLLWWRPTADEPRMFFVAAGLWAVFVGVIWSQLRAFYGVLFKADEEAAFAAFHVWYSLGFSVSFAYSNYLCTSIKIYILIAICILGFAGYLWVEIMHLKNKRQK